jgi:hypothetical protein
MTDLLHFYKCRACLQTLTSPARAVSGSLWRCIACYSPMQWQYAMPITTRRERQWAAYGVLLNPGLTTCDVCGVKLTPTTRRELCGLGVFCSMDCADARAAKRE